MLFESECQIERTQERLLTNYYSLFKSIFELFCFETRFIFPLELLTKKRFRFRIILIQKKRGNYTSGNPLRKLKRRRLTKRL